MKLLRSDPWYDQGNSQRLIAVAFIAIALIAAADAVVIPFVGFGFLYLIPLGIAAVFLPRWQIVVISIICTAFSEGFAKLPDGAERVPRALFMLVAYLFVTFVIRGLAIYRRAASRRLAELEIDLANLHGAEKETELLMNTTAVGILTVSGEGKIVKSNRAAHEMLGVGPGGLTGQPISQFLPIELSAHADSPIECSARTATGQAFSVRVFTSKFSQDGTNMTGIIIDASPKRTESGAARS